MLTSKRRLLAVVASLGGVLGGGAVTLVRAPGMPTTASSRSLPAGLGLVEQHLRQEQLALLAQTNQVASTKRALAAEAAQLAAEASKLSQAAAQAPPAAHTTTGASGASGGGDGGGSGGDG